MKRPVIRPDHRRRADGFTLVEMLLALAVLLMLAGLSWPLLERLTGQTYLKRGTEQVRVELGATRLRAIDAGMIYQFRYEPGGRRYIVLPFEPYDEGRVENEPSGGSPLHGSLVEDGEIPEGLTFQLSENETAVQAIDADWLNLSPNSAQLSKTAWSSPLLFFTDGSAVDGELSVIDEHDRSLRVVVRELTGAVRVETPTDE